MKKIAVVGLGSIAKRHLANLKAIYPDVKTFAISSSGLLPRLTLDNVDFMSTNIEDAVKFKPDFAIVASPATHHFHHTKKLIEANIPVLIEKPMTASSEEGNALMSLARQVKIPIAIGYCLRYLPAIRVVKEMLDTSKIGRIYNVFAHVGQYLPNWRTDKHYKASVSASSKLGGGALLELSHELDYLQWLFGELEFKYAILRNTNELALEVEEIADVILTTKLGVVCTIHLDFIQKCTQRYCYFIGEKGHIHLDLLTHKVSLFVPEGEKVVFNDPAWNKNNMYLLMLKDFIAKIGKNNQNERSLLDAQRTVNLINTIKACAVWGVQQ